MLTDKHLIHQTVPIRVSFAGATKYSGIAALVAGMRKRTECRIQVHDYDVDLYSITSVVVLPFKYTTYQPLYLHGVFGFRTYARSVRLHTSSHDMVGTNIQTVLYVLIFILV